MRRFAQKSQETDPELLKFIGKEGLSEIEYNQKVKEYLESEKKMIQYCKDLKLIGTAIKTASAGIKEPYGVIAIGLSNLGDKLVDIGDDVIGAIQAKNNTIFGLGVGAALTSTYQPSAKIKTPSFKRFIPLIGDVVNFTYTLNLKPTDFSDPIKKIFTPYKCSGNHPDSKAPLLNFLISPNFKDHPELEEQQREKLQSFSSLVLNLGSLIQNVEAALALIGTFAGRIDFVAAVRIAGGLIQTAITAISVLFSPNTYDISAFGSENFRGQGIDKSNPLSILNLTGYPQLYETKPIAEESQKAGEGRVQNLTLSSIYTENGESFAVIKDNLGNYEALAVGEKWPKWNITITGIFSNHVEYKDSSGKIYSIRKYLAPFQTPEKYKTDYPGTAFYEIIKDAANLSTSGVKGDVDKLLSKKASDIISLMYQLKNKYPWIGDSKNAKWINLQSDILTHLIREPKKRKPTPKPVATTPKPTAVPNLREISLENYKQKYFREDQSQLIPERRGSAVRVKLQEVMDAIKSGTLSNTNWDKWSDIGKQAIIEEAIDRLQNAGFNVLGPRADRRMGFVPTISKDILDQLSPKYKSSR